MVVWWECHSNHLNVWLRLQGSPRSNQMIIPVVNQVLLPAQPHFSLWSILGLQPQSTQPEAFSTLKSDIHRVQYKHVIIPPLSATWLIYLPVIKEKLFTSLYWSLGKDSNAMVAIDHHHWRATRARGKGFRNQDMKVHDHMGQLVWLWLHQAV